MNPAARGHPPRGRARLAVLAGALFLVALFLGLAVWQIERHAWKHDLIAAVDARIHAAPVAVPEPARWASVTAANDAYRRVCATGRYLDRRGTLVRAVTDLGAGYWVMTPFDGGGFTLFVNRGFVPQDRRNAYDDAPAGRVSVTGLLRIGEPRGGFLRNNDPVHDRWYSRDVETIGRARGLGRVAPYFIDADAAPGADAYPRGGMTVVRFPDNHLVYALTWFAMALLSAWAGWRALRQGRGAA